MTRAALLEMTPEGAVVAVIQEDIGQFPFVFRPEKCFDGARWQFGERVIGRRENREPAGALQRVSQPGGSHGTDDTNIVG